MEDTFPDSEFKEIPDPYREIISKIVFALLGGLSLAFILPLM